MAAIDDLRTQFPQYNKYSDQELADAVYQKGGYQAQGYKPEDFYKAIGFDPTIPKRTTEGMGTFESVKELTRTGMQYGTAALAALPHDIATAQVTHFTPDDLKQAHDEWNASHGHPMGPYTYVPEMYDRAKEIALARDANARRPVFGETVKQFGEQHLLSAADVLRHMSEVGKQQGGTGEFTRPTEASGRILQHGVEAATMAAPALLAGPAAGAGAIASTGGSAMAGQGLREIGAPEPLATATEIVGSLASPAEAYNIARGVSLLPRTAAAHLMQQGMADLTPLEVSQAQDLVRYGQSTNNPITWAEAANAVTNGRISGMADLQRVVEKIGAPQIADIMSRREGAARANVETQATRIGGPQLQGGPQGGDLGVMQQNLRTQGERALQSVRRERTEAVAPYYREGDVSPTEQMVQPNYDEWVNVMNRPVVRQAFDTAATTLRNRGQRIPQFFELDNEGNVLRVRQMPTPQAADEMHRELQNRIDKAMQEGDTAQAQGYISARDAFDALTADVPGYARGREVYQEMTPGVERTEAGPLAAVASREGTAEDQFSRAMQAIVPNAPRITDAATARSVVRMLRQNYTRGGEVAPGVNQTINQALGQYIRTMVDDAARQFKGKMAPQDAGAAFKAALTGRTRQADILRAVIEEAAGPQAWQGFQRMLDVFEAQGYRAAPGSQTTFNQMIKDAMEAPRFGTSLPEIGTAVATGGRSLMLRGLKGLEERAATRRGQATARSLSEMLLDPESADTWRSLAQMSPYSPNAARLVARLFGVGGAVGAEQGPQPTWTPPPPELPSAPR